MTLISVVIPTYNAEATLPPTLRSALAQSHRDIEVLVVDDGSTDASPAIAERFAAEDDRVRVIRRNNGGVAEARNTGLSAARGAFIAPLDADDLWHPRKLELQLARFETAGPDTGLVYNWSRRIDENDRIFAEAASPLIEGRVLHRLIGWNFIGNGSTPLIRADVCEQIHYNPLLHRAGNQGCEDYLFQMQVACRHHFACVPAFLTGYRRLPLAMSQDIARMLRSNIQAFQIMADIVPPEARRVIRARTAELKIELVRNRLHRGRVREAAVAFGSALRTAPLSALSHTATQISLALHRGGNTRAPGSSTVWQSFHEVDPWLEDSPWRPSRAMTKLDQLDNPPDPPGSQPGDYPRAA